MRDIKILNNYERIQLIEDDRLEKKILTEDTAWQECITQLQSKYGTENMPRMSKQWKKNYIKERVIRYHQNKIVEENEDKTKFQYYVQERATIKLGKRPIHE